MSNITEIIGSLTSENAEEVREKLMAEASALNESNRRLYSRAKRAEGFEYNKTDKQWAKPAPKSETNKPNTQDNKLDYGQLAFYNSRSDAVKIEADDDIKHLEETMKVTGKSQLDLLKAKWFLSELKERQDERTTIEATPSSSKTAPQTGKDSVEYWVEKGELPADKSLKQKVVNAKIAREKSAGDSSESAVISSIPSTSGLIIK